MNNFITRTLSAIVYAGLVIGGILVQPICFGGHPLLFGILFMIVSTLAVREFHALVGSDIKTMTYAMMSNALLYSTLYFLFFGDLIWRGLLVAYIAIMLLALISHLFRPQVQPIQSWGNLCAGQVMIALPFALMNGVLMHSKWLMLALFILLWVNDSGAYIVGSLMAKRKGGNHKMFPRVSPAKSWEGLIGGFIFDFRCSKRHCGTSKRCSHGRCSRRSGTVHFSFGRVVPLVRNYGDHAPLRVFQCSCPSLSSCAAPSFPPCQPGSRNALCPFRQYLGKPSGPWQRGNTHGHSGGRRHGAKLPRHCKR